jgi:hypothetical protein
MEKSSPANSGPSALEKGARVHLKKTTLGESLGIKPYTIKGGEAVVNTHSVDSAGRITYQVTLLRNGRSRSVRREDLVVHQKSNQKHYRSKQ